MLRITLLLILSMSLLFVPATADDGIDSPGEPPIVTLVQPDHPSSSGETFHLSLHEAPAHELFRILSQSTGTSFVLDRDVNTRISADWQGANQEDVLAALGAASIYVGDGPLHRVSTTPDPTKSFEFSEEYAGAPYDLELTDAPLREALCGFAKFGLRIVAPPDVKGRVTLFARQAPWDAVLEGILASNGLAYRPAGSRILVDRPGKASKLRDMAATPVCGDRSTTPGSG